MRTFELKPFYDSGADYIRCLVCGFKSYNKHDIEHQYCGNCKQFHPIETTQTQGK